jgi:formylglycine-generating enzyme required for sulfatase activity
MRNVERSMRKVNDSLYANAFECTLNDYRYFLDDMKSQGKDVTPYLADSLNTICGFNTNWKHSSSTDYLKYFLSHPAYANYPIRAISKEAAYAFCVWLTESYGQYDRAKFHNVTFTLPSEKEWMRAAYGISEKKKDKIFDKLGVFDVLNYDYPWLNNKAYMNRNKWSKWVDLNQLYFGLNVMLLLKVDYRKANFHDEIYGYTETKNVKSYRKNKIGLYNMSGNVSEMTNHSDVVKGGSFALDVYDCGINNSRVKYIGPAIDVGFRVFMKTN